jgi:hypothetical protein
MPNLFSWTFAGHFAGFDNGSDRPNTVKILRAVRPDPLDLAPAATTAVTIFLSPPRQALLQRGKRNAKLLCDLRGR